MGNNRIYKLISRIVDIKPGEVTIAVLLFLYFFLITSPFTMIKSLRNAIFLSELGSEMLPFAYGTAILMGMIVAFHSKLQIKLSRKLLIISSIVFFIITAILFYFALPMAGSWLALVFWIWSSIFVLVLVTQFWITVNDIFNPREAKRLIGFFVSGGILGGVLGGISTKFLAKSNEAYHLLLVAVALLFLGAVVVNAIFTWQEKSIASQDKERPESKKAAPDKSNVGFMVCFNTVRKNYYLTLLASVIAITAVVSIFIDWQMNTVIAQNDAIKDNMTAFFGLFYAVILVVPFLIQLLFTSNLIKRFGIRFTLLLYPVILLLCCAGIAIWPILIFAIIIKASDKSFSFSINQSARELLYIPVSPDIKYRAKIFIDMFLVRFSESFAALLLLVVVFILPLQFEIAFVSLISAFFILLWILLNLKVSKEYVTTVKQNIRVKWGRADKDVAEKVDVDYTKLVFDTLESKNRSSVLYAMHLYDLLQQDKLTPEIKSIISQKADEVTASSLGDLFDVEGSAWDPGIEDEIIQEDLKTDIQEIMSLDAYQEVMKLHTDHVMEESKKTEIEKMEVAKAIGMMDPNAPMVDRLQSLIYDASPEVARYAIESAAKLKKEEFLPALVNKLPNPLTREDAVAALNKYGTTAIGPLQKYLGDVHKDIDLRRAVVDALARIGTQDATDALMRELDRKATELDTEIIDALDRIRSEKPEIHISAKIAKRETFAIIKKYCQEFLELKELTPSKKDAELGDKLQKEMTTNFMNIFKLLGLYYPHEDIVKAYQNIKTGTKDSVAFAIELLDNTLKRDVRDLILPLIEDLSSSERERKFQHMLKNFPKY